MHSDTLWQPAPPALSPELAALACDRGSLTERLGRTGCPFSVEVLYQGHDQAYADEHQLAGLIVTPGIYTRHVALLLGATPVVVARSITALHDSYWQETLQRGKRSLGLSLFGNQDNIVRDTMLFRTIWPDHPLFSLAAGQDALQAASYPARRSSFMHDGAALNVCEVFLPALEEFL
jgi:chorismate--pyruvate lyase